MDIDTILGLLIINCYIPFLVFVAVKLEVI